MSPSWIIEIAALIKLCPIITSLQISGLTNDEVMFIKFSSLSYALLWAKCFVSPEPPSKIFQCWGEAALFSCFQF